MKGKCTDKQARQLFAWLGSELDKAIARYSYQVIARQNDIDALVDTLTDLGLKLKDALEGTGTQQAQWTFLEQFDNGNEPYIPHTSADSVSKRPAHEYASPASLPKSINSNAQLSQDLSNEKTNHRVTKEELRKIRESYESLFPKYRENEALLKTANAEIYDLTQKIANFESDILGLRTKIEEREKEAHAYFEKALQLEEASRPFNPLKVNEFLRATAGELPPAFRAFVEELVRLADCIEQYSLDSNASHSEIKGEIDRIAEFVYQLPPGKDLIASDRFTPAERVYQVTLLQNRLQHQLEGAGLGLIYPAVGEAFDSNKHHSDDTKIHWFRKGYSHNTIAAVNAVGFAFNGQVLKKAQIEKYMRDQTGVAEQEIDVNMDSAFASKLENHEDQVQEQFLLAGEIETFGEDREVTADTLISPSSTAQSQFPANEEQNVEAGEIAVIQEQSEESHGYSFHGDASLGNQEEEIPLTLPPSESMVPLTSTSPEDVAQRTSEADGITPAEPEINSVEPNELGQPSPKSRRKSQVPEEAYE